MPSTDTLHNGILDLVLSAGPVAKTVLLILLGFSIVSWALIVEKWWQFRRVKRQTLAFLKIYREGRRGTAVHAAVKKYRESPLAQLYAAAYQEVAGIEDTLDDVDDPGIGVEVAQRAMRRAAGHEVLDGTTRVGADLCRGGRRHGRRRRGHDEDGGGEPPDDPSGRATTHVSLYADPMAFC